MKKYLFIITVGFSLFCNSQNTGEDETGAWYMYFGTNKISDKFSIHSEAQFRFYDFGDSFNQMLLRTGLNYHINENAILTGGYAYIDTDPTFENNAPLVNTVLEHRLFEQFILKNKVWELLFEHRYRLEQRFIRNRDLQDSFTEHRARYRLQVTLPLTDTFFLNFYDEVFINLQGDIFGQNRLFLAGGVHLTSNSSVQIGYLKNHFNNANFDRFQLAIFYNPDLSGLFKSQ
ncbi:MAG: DUF2490 domain-containing protein [Croceitalea sp.]|nr:DUF2490 domain-containing protein [Croceitalea sp.]